MKLTPDLIQDGHRRIWAKVFTLSGVPYCKIDGCLRPVTFHEKRGIYIALPLSISPKQARYLK
jgi:hypothetical protein